MKQLLGKVVINEHWKRTKTGTKYANGFIGGYPGLTLTARRISEYIPYCKLFVEPFAGLGRVSKKVKAEKKVLNDMSNFAYEYNKKKFKTLIVTQEDFTECIKRWDSKDTFFFMDPPWRFMQYDPKQTLAYCDRTIKQYYEDLLKMVPILKGDWIIAGEVHEKESGKLLQNSGYPNLVIKTNYKMLGGRIQVRLCSNKPFVNYHQTTLPLIREVTKE